MCSIMKAIKRGGLFIFVVGILLFTVCKNPADGETPPEPLTVNPPDKSALTDKIAVAEQLSDSLVVSVDGTDVDTSSFWVNSAEKWALTCAIEDAQQIADSPNATDEEIRLALDALAEAVNKANEAKKAGGTGGGDNPSPGTGTGGGEDNPSPGTGIGGGEDNPSPGTGTGGGEDNPSPGTGTGGGDNPSPGTGIGGDDDPAPAPPLVAGDKSGLSALIDEAKKKKTGIVQAARAQDVSTTQEWATPEMFTALNEAIAAGEAAVQNENATQQEVDTVRSLLVYAIGGFDPQKGTLKGTVISTPFINPDDEAIDLTLSGTNLSWDKNDMLTITVQQSFSAYQWYVDGALLSGKTNNEITLAARDFHIGTHTVTVKVTANGMPYTKTLTFKVS